MGTVVLAVWPVDAYQPARSAALRAGAPRMVGPFHVAAEVPAGGATDAGGAVVDEVAPPPPAAGFPPEVEEVAPAAAGAGSPPGVRGVAATVEGVTTGGDGRWVTVETTTGRAGGAIPGVTAA
ncbi:MAG TPA: hypothetical protein VKU91_03665, partial [Acidimicrobiales bacterium]|nr:hypothetical protein [Acidimicrobiales bacterium]